ncbi:MAG: hypothetical protein ACRD22_01155 [Terriglobia bacterium]
MGCSARKTKRLSSNPSGRRKSGAVDYERNRIPVGGVLRRWPEINPARLVVVEHYDDRPARVRASARARRILDIGREQGESFDLVTFDAGIERLREVAAGVRRYEPIWKHTTKTAVEDLIGGYLP